MGRKIIVNDELTFTCPDPKDKSDIFFLDKKKKEQHWPIEYKEIKSELGLPEIFFDWTELTVINHESTIYDEDGNLTHLSIEDTQELREIRDRELTRRREGIHFMNHGEVEYITGNNYYFLVYYKIPAVGSPQFRKFQRDVFYVIELALVNPNILGAYFAKAKKTGLSHIIASIFLNEATTIRDRSFGIINKSQPEANDLNINFFWRGYEELPPIMAPKVSHKNLSMVKFGAPLIKYTGTEQSLKKIQTQKRNKPLNTWIFSAPTQIEVKFDGPAMYFVHLDEFPKWKVSPKKMYGKITETVKLQQTINGKIWITSYPPEEDGQGFEEGKEVYYDSKVSTIKPGGLGRTTSGLICHFVSALDSTDGTFDIYGNADRAEALRRNQAERNQCKNNTELQEKIRQYPRTEEECWRSGGNGSTFDNVHLAIALQANEVRQRKGEILGIEGNYSWSNGRFTPVLFTPVTEAEKQNKVKGWFTEWEGYDTKHFNRCYKDSDGFWRPPVDSKFIMSADPMEYKMGNTVKKDPSDASITVMSFPDVERDTRLLRTASKLITHTYCDRRDDPDDFLEDLIMAIFRHSCYVVIEANKQWVITAFIKLGLQFFLLVRQKDGSIIPWEWGGENYAVTSTTTVIETYCRLIRSYLRWPHNNSEEIDYCVLMKNMKLIKNLMRFNPDRTKEFDDVVTLGYVLMAMEAFSVFKDKLHVREAQDNIIPAVLEAITGYV